MMKCIVADSDKSKSNTNFEKYSGGGSISENGAGNAEV